MEDTPTTSTVVAQEVPTEAPKVVKHYPLENIFLHLQEVIFQNKLDEDGQGENPYVASQEEIDEIFRRIRSSTPASIEFQKGIRSGIRGMTYQIYYASDRPEDVNWKVLASILRQLNKMGLHDLQTIRYVDDEKFTETGTALSFEFNKTFYGPDETSLVVETQKSEVASEATSS